MTEFAVLLGGKIEVTDRLRGQVAGRTAIAADSGIAHAAPLGLEPVLWVGDFDSATDDQKQAYQHVPREAWSTDKDLTDSEIAIGSAYRMGARSLVLVGAFGGRTDHSANHLLSVFGLAGEVMLTSGREEALPLRGTVAPQWPKGTTFSILALDDLEGLTIEGARWPLRNTRIPSGSGHTLSNEVDGTLSVSVHSGRALLIGMLAD